MPIVGFLWLCLLEESYDYAYYMMPIIFPIISYYFSLLALNIFTDSSGSRKIAINYWHMIKIMCVCFKILNIYIQRILEGKQSN